MSPPSAVLRTEFPGLRFRGKVRDIYDLGTALMIVASDRISAFDVVMNEPIPDKGVLLTRLSAFWLETLPVCRPHHLEYVVERGRVPRGYESHVSLLAGRAMVVRKASVIPVECVARGYLVGGGWKEYQAAQSVSGVKLRPGLRLSERLEEPIFTPSTKADQGHDEPISFDQACRVLADSAGRLAGAEAAFGAWSGGRELAGATSRELLGWARDVLSEARTRTLDVYRQGSAHAAQRGIILADTKLEFGFVEGVLTLVDEVLTPDSSRFWPADRYVIGANPPSFDKQYLRDYLESQRWSKEPPPPPLPEWVVEQTRQRYVEAFELLTGA
jgi:phosphoribosylaminoimidazole-succinocarboxamide synthase